MNQAQKLFPLVRGDCCLAFCGDAQVAYPFFIQVATALDNHIKTRTRALDVTRLTSTIGKMLNKLIDAWDISKKEKLEQLATTRILVGGCRGKIGGSTSATLSTRRAAYSNSIIRKRSRSIRGMRRRNRSFSLATTKMITWLAWTPS